MRKITLRLTDYDEVSDEDVIIDYPAYLISPTIALYSDSEGIYFHYYNEPIAKNEELVYMKDDKYSITLFPDRGNTPEISIDDLPNLTIAELGVLLKGMR